MRSVWATIAFGAGLWLAPAGAQQPDLIVEKKVFELPSYTTAGGKVIKNVRIGWEAYGQPNADRSNVVLVTHFFSGTSHAAGKYAPGDKAPGYWDPIIGPGKAIDTNKYYVISSDTLVNLNANTPNVVTTGSGEGAICEMPIRSVPPRSNSSARAGCAATMASDAPASSMRCRVFNCVIDSSLDPLSDCFAMQVRARSRCQG